MFIFVRLLAVLVVLPSFAVAGSPDLHREPLPDWVTQTEIPDVDPALLNQTRYGIYYLLNDLQVRWQDGNRETYLRSTYKVLERAGLEEAAKIVRQFNPSFDTLTLYRLTITRDGEVIDIRDATPDAIFRRESDFERGILDGTLTAHMEISDLRVGDIVDLAFGWVQEPLVPGLNYTAYSQMEWGVPLGRNHMRVLWPTDVSFAKTETQTGLTYSETSAERYIERIWQADSIPAAQVDDDVPNWVPVYGAVELSGHSWKDVSQALLEYYDRPHDLPQDYLAKVDAIAASGKDEAGRIGAALRLVQDTVRYVGIEIGSGAYYARPPVTVLERGFGDCKDKAVLLRATLNRLGIAADVALVHSSLGLALKQDLPSAGRFNHMIVKVHAEGGPVWLDPTLSHQGGSGDSLAQPRYSYALPIAPGTDDLEPMEIDVPTDPDIIVRENYIFGDEGLDLKIISYYRDQAADNFRYDLATKSRYELFGAYFDYYARRYPGLTEVEPPHVKDSLESNEIHLTEIYHLPTSALEQKEVSEEFVFATTDFLSRFSDVANEPRVSPLWQPYPLNREHIVKVINGPIEFEAPDRIEIDNDYLNFRMISASFDTSMQMRWTIRTKAPQVAAVDVAAYLDDLDEASRNTKWWWNLYPEEPAEEAKSFLERLLERQLQSE